jgi:Bifunctional DNA primase/polymerase, N-terminal
MTDAIFAQHAETLRRAGFAVLPLQGKRPIRKGFTKWTSGPSLATLAGWADKHPASSIGYIPGLCHAGQDGDALVVIDADGPGGRISTAYSFSTPPKVLQS